MSKKSNKDKSTYIRLAINQAHIQFAPDPVRTGLKSVLTIDRMTGKFSEHKILMDETKAKIVNTYGLLGVLQVYGKPILFYIDEAQQVATFHSHAIYKIQSVTALKILSDQQSDQMELDTTHQICKYLRQSMFFSHVYDLTLDCSTNKSKDEKLRMKKSHRFWWNFHMLEPMFKENISQEWCLRAIQGYTGSFQVDLMTGQTLEYVLLSRREWLRGGTRYNHRGIDEQGNTANYVETEQIIRIDDIVCSHLQIRGSVPIYWHQVGIKATCELTKDFSGSKVGFLKHFEQLTQNHKKIFCVNLMAKESSNENIITKNFEEQLKQTDQINIKYQFVDFHHICKNFNFEALNPTIMKNQELIQSFSFSSYDSQHQKQEQQGILRTNCLDCLDRTNVFQTKIALVVAYEILVRMGVNVFKEFNSQSLLYMADVANLQSHKFINNLKQTWADNGDAISKVYVGTNATTTKIQNQGGGKWAGIFEKSMKGIERLYRQNFEDHRKQDIYELIVGRRDLKSEDNHMQLMNQIHSKIQQEREEKDTTALLVINWNLHNFSPNRLDLQISELLEIGEERSPDIIVILITNYKSIRQADGKIVENWKGLFIDLVQQHFGKYEQMVSSSMYQQITFVYIKSAHMTNISKVENSSVQFSTDRGALVTKLQGKQTFGIINTCLDKDTFLKTVQINQIHTEAFRSTIYTQYLSMLDQCDFVIYGGDLNFTINVDKACDLTVTNNEQLYPRDQIHILKKKTDLTFFNEPTIMDPPLTYMEKHETLQWRNRILFGSSKGFISNDKIYKRLDKFSRNPILNAQMLFTHIYQKDCLSSSPTSDIVDDEQDVVQEEDLNEMLISSHYYSPIPNQLEVAHSK